MPKESRQVQNLTGACVFATAIRQGKQSFKDATEFGGFKLTTVLVISAFAVQAAHTVADKNRGQFTVVTYSKK